jgi:hypothetical protein
LSAESSKDADLWIYPGKLIGDMIALDCISPLPSAAAGKLFDSNDESTEKHSRSVPEQWPARWRASSRFGSTQFALPLGAPQLVAVSRNISLLPLDPLDDPNSKIEDRTSTVAEAWRTILTDASPNAANAESQKRFQERLASLTESQKDAIVDRFLWIASTTNAKRRGLFDLNKVKAKLSSPDFVLAADVLSRLASVFPDTWLATHDEAWKVMISQKGNAKSMAIAFPPDALPSNNDSDNRTSAESEELQFCKVVWNPSQGLLASVGKKTRQTSVASQFIAWLSDAEQRDALAARSTGVERWPSQPNGNSVRADYRAYQNLNNRDSRMEQPTLAIRFQSSQEYRAILSDYLIQILKEPSSSRVKLEECAQQWNALTDKIGLSSIRPSIEQATGFSQ